MPRDIRVGDKVRLLGWEGSVAGLGFVADGMADYVGQEFTIDRILNAGNGDVFVLDGWRWPLSVLDRVDSSPWTKTSEGKPDVGVWVLGWLPCDGAAKERGFPDQYVCRRSLSNPDAWEVESVTPWLTDDFLSVNAPDYWQPLPAPPEVSK